MKTNTQTAKIVSEMLATAQTKKALSLVAIKNLSSKVNDAEKQRFMTSLELAQLLAQTKEQFEQFFIAVKNALKDGGATSKDMVSKADFIKLVYGFKASYYYKLLKVGELPKNVVNKFCDKCDEAEKDGKDFARSIEALNTWAKNFETHKGEADADAESISDLRNGGEKRVVKSAFKFENIKVTFFENGSFETNSTAFEIREAFDLFTMTITSTFPRKNKTTAKEKQVLSNVQKERVKKIPTNVDLF
jgi:hypothetical protein